MNVITRILLNFFGLALPCLDYLKIFHPNAGITVLLQPFITIYAIALGIMYLFLVSKNKRLTHEQQMFWRLSTFALGFIFIPIYNFIYLKPSQAFKDKEESNEP